MDDQIIVAFLFDEVLFFFYVLAIFLGPLIFFCLIGYSIFYAALEILLIQIDSWLWEKGNGIKIEN